MLPRRGGVGRVGEERRAEPELGEAILPRRGGRRGAGVTAVTRRVAAVVGRTSGSSGVGGRNGLRIGGR